MPDIARARQMMAAACGEGHFYGPDELLKTFPGLTLSAQDLPEPPPEEEIARHAALGHTLRLRVGKAPDGSPLTIKTMHDLLHETFARQSDGEVVYDVASEWKVASPFYAGEAPRPGWAFTGNEVIAGSTGRNYLDQTSVLADYLRKTLFKKAALPLAYQDTIREFDAGRGELKHLLANDWKTASGKLVSLKVNTLLRGSVSEMLQDILVTFQNSDPSKRVRLLERMWAWTSTQSADGLIVNIGNFDKGGVYISHDLPDSSSKTLGVIFSLRFG